MIVSNMSSASTDSAVEGAAVEARRVREGSWGVREEERDGAIFMMVRIEKKKKDTREEKRVQEQLFCK